MKTDFYVSQKDGKTLRYFFKSYFKHYLKFKHSFTLMKYHGAYCRLKVYDKRNRAVLDIDLKQNGVLVFHKNGHFLQKEKLKPMMVKLNNWSRRGIKDAEVYANFIKMGIKKQRVMEIMELTDNKLELRAIYNNFLTGSQCGMKTIGDYNIWYKPCKNCGYDTGKSTKPKSGMKYCWQCGHQINRDFSDRALKK